jgi:hypothetical protein
MTKLGAGSCARVANAAAKQACINKAVLAYAAKKKMG